MITLIKKLHYAFYRNILSKVRHLITSHCLTRRCVCAHVCITCTGQLLVVDTPPQPAEPPAGTLTDTLTSPPQRNESWNKHSQILFAN